VDISNIVINGLTLISSGGLGGNRVCYVIRNHEHPSRKAVFPSIRKMKGLARKFLNCKYMEGADRLKERNNYGMLFFIIDGRIHQENRIAFLAAVAIHTEFSGIRTIKLPYPLK